MPLYRFLNVFAAGVVFFWGLAAARAQEEYGQGTAPAGGNVDSPTRPVSLSVPLQATAPIEALMSAGEYDKAIEEAKSLQNSSPDESVKTEAQRLMADALRKKGQWKDATVAYGRVRDRYTKSSDDYLKYQTIAEILRTSPTGTYRAVVPDTTGGDPPTLADDAHLTEALRRQAGLLVKKVLLRASVLRRAKTPREIVTLFADVAEGFRQARVLDPNMAAKDVRETAQMAGTRLQELADTMVPQLRAKAAKIRVKRERPWSYTNVEKEDIQKCSALVKECASVEGQFQGLLGKVGGSGEWAEGDAIRSQSSDRAATYQSLDGDFVVLPYDTTFWW
jgi:tetratricopeptide (TPR) repeat protein